MFLARRESEISAKFPGRRGDCCTPLGTFWGINTGISVMLPCFEPGVFFLFVERFERLKPKSTGTDKSAN
jgi:hypothetical protein